MVLVPNAGYSLASEKSGSKEKAGLSIEHQKVIPLAPPMMKEAHAVRVPAVVPQPAHENKLYVICAEKIEIRGGSLVVVERIGPFICDTARNSNILVSGLRQVLHGYNINVVVGDRP